MTVIFLLLLVALFIFVTFLPLRFILTLSTAYKFYKGLSWQKRRRVNNEEVCRIEMENFFHENKIVKVTEYDERWEPQLIKIKDSDFNRKSNFEQKLSQYFQSIVRIYLPKDVLNTCVTPNQLIEYVGCTPFVIQLP